MGKQSASSTVKMPPLAAVLRILRLTVVSVLLVCVVLTLLSQCERIWWRAYLIAQLRVEFFIVSLAIFMVLALLLRNSKLLMVMAAASTVTNAIPLSPALIYNTAPRRSVSKTFKILQINLNERNRQYDRVISYVQSVKPDLLLLEEVSPRWAEVLQKRLPEFPQHAFVPQTGTYGIALLGKAAVSQPHIEYFGRGGHPSIVCAVGGFQKPITILHTHIQGPVRKQLFEMHREQIEALGVYAQTLRKPLLVCGDMNCTPWTYLLSDFLRKTDLRDSQNGIGIELSWPVPMYWRKEPFVLLSIDHFFLSSEIEVVSRKIGPSVGSDHYPVILEIDLPE